MLNVYRLEVRLEGGMNYVVRPTSIVRRLSKPFHRAQFLLNSLLRRLNRRHFFIQWQNIRFWPYRRDREGVDLLVALRVVVSDMLELCRLAEGWNFPVEVADPSEESSV